MSRFFSFKTTKRGRDLEEAIEVDHMRRQRLNERERPGATAVHGGGRQGARDGPAGTCAGNVRKHGLGRRAPPDEWPLSHSARGRESGRTGRQAFALASLRHNQKVLARARTTATGLQGRACLIAAAPASTPCSSAPLQSHTHHHRFSIVVPRMTQSLAESSLRRTNRTATDTTAAPVRQDGRLLRGLLVGSVRRRQ